MRDNLEIKVIINWTNRQSKTHVLQINQHMDGLALEEIMPTPTLPMHPWELKDDYDRRERRDRLINAIASNIAIGVTEGLFEEVRKKYG